MQQSNIPQSPHHFYPTPTPPRAFFPVKTKELVLVVFFLISGLFLCNSIFYAGFRLGFAVFASLSLLGAVCYLLISGCRPTVYSTALLVLCLCMITGFARSNDGFVKFILLGFLLFGENLALCLLAGHNRYLPGCAASLLDAPYTLFALGFGKLPRAFRGLRNALRSNKGIGRKSGAILIGCAIAVPIVAIVIPLLTKADAAFDGLLDMLPDWDISEIPVTLIFGTFPAFVLYIRATALLHHPKAPMEDRKVRKGVNALTVNTVLICISLVYGIYLFSQLAYFSGGFLGVLPEEYTLSEYARRGFFEMAWLCAINLTLMVLAVSLVRKQEKVPFFTRLLCLFVGIVTLFLVFAASAKMFLYIHTYGLTRLRVLTEVIMVWFALTAVVISLWLFIPKIPYMKVILIFSLLIGSAVLWADVDTVVARYNVTAYQSGQLETVDVDYLTSLDYGAFAYIARLTTDSDPEVAANATDFLKHYPIDTHLDFREWNYVEHIAKKYVLLYQNRSLS